MTRFTECLLGVAKDTVPNPDQVEAESHGHADACLRSLDCNTLPLRRVLGRGRVVLQEPESGNLRSDGVTLRK